MLRICARQVSLRMCACMCLCAFLNEEVVRPFRRGSRMRARGKQVVVCNGLCAVSMPPCFVRGVQSVFVVFVFNVHFRRWDRIPSTLNMSFDASPNSLQL